MSELLKQLAYEQLARANTQRTAMPALKELSRNPEVSTIPGGDVTIGCVVFSIVALLLDCLGI